MKFHLTITGSAEVTSQSCAGPLLPNIDSTSTSQLIEQNNSKPDILESANNLLLLKNFTPSANATSIL